MNAANSMAAQKMFRRTFVKTAVTAGAGAALAWAEPAADAAASARRSWTDTNTNLFHWPLRRFVQDTTPALVQSLRQHGITEAWAGSLDGLLHKDLGAVNAHLAEECRRYGRHFLVPFGSVNPAAPDWEEELRRCAKVHQMPGIRLHPNYHGYSLDTPAFARLLRQAAELGLLVQLSLVMEDERMMHPRLRVEPVEPAPLPALLKQTPGLRLILLNALRTLRGPALKELLAAGEVFVEFSMLEGVGGLEQLLQQLPAERVLFGSHTPLFYFESAALKLRESALEPQAEQLIRVGNARRVLAQPGPWVRR